MPTTPATREEAYAPVLPIREGTASQLVELKPEQEPLRTHLDIQQL
jgi:hypothetical protein